MTMEPVVAYPIRDVLARIEHKLDENTTAIHQLQISAASVQAVSRARAALFTAAVSAAAAGAALIVAFTHH